MQVLLAVEIVLIGMLFILSRGRYKELLKAPECKNFSLTWLMPVSLLILEWINYRYINKYDRKLMKLISSLYGVKYANINIRLYYCEKLTAMILTLAAFTFLGAAAQTVELTYVILTLSSPLLVFFMYDKELEKKQQRKYSLIRADFPDMVSKLVLLVNAGMTLNRAWEKICTDTKKDTPLYKELKITYQQIQAGKPEGEAYEDFAKRCRVKEITKFITLIIQNLKKGTGDLVPLLKLQADECWELRKGRAKQLGDEASAKLIIPMMIMFVGILIIVILPAVLQLKSI